MAYEDEILQKADALMKKHRAKAAEKQGIQPSKQIPILTDIVDELPTDSSDAVMELTLDAIPSLPEASEIEAAAAPAEFELSIDKSVELPIEMQKLAEQIYQKVLLDLEADSDKAIQKYLAPRLEGLLEGAFYVVMEEFNRNVGEMIREYVANAIEAELKRKIAESNSK